MVSTFFMLFAMLAGKCLQGLSYFSPVKGGEQCSGDQADPAKGRDQIPKKGDIFPGGIVPQKIRRGEHANELRKPRQAGGRSHDPTGICVQHKLREGLEGVSGTQPHGGKYEVVDQNDAQGHEKTAGDVPEFPQFWAVQAQKQRQTAADEEQCVAKRKAEVFPP